MSAGAGSNTVWYRVVASSNGSLSVSTAGSDYDTVLAIYAGSRGNLTRVAFNDDIDYDAGELQSQVAFNVSSSTTYFIGVAGYGVADKGTLQLRVEHSNSLVPTATVVPSATPIPSPTWTWYTPSTQSTLPVDPAPANDDFNSAVPIDALPFSSIISTTGATSASDDPAMTASGDRHSSSVWYRLLVPSAGTVKASTLGSDYDTVLAVFTGARGGLTLVASNDDARPSVQAEVTFSAQAGTAYHIEVAQYGTPGGGNLALRVSWLGGQTSATPFGTPGMYGTPGISGTPGVAAAGATPLPVRLSGPVPRDDRYFPETGYRVSLDPFWDYFQKRGGVGTFGYPISWEFPLFGFKVQMFQRSVLQLKPDGSVATMNLLDEGLMPYTRINFSTFPAPERQLIDSAPSPLEPDYGLKAIAFVEANVPDEWEGMAVGFHRAFLSTVRYEDAYPNGDGDAGLLPLLDLELWGLPTSRPAPDPDNDSFVYQRFQRGIMHYDATTGATQGLLLADYLKSIMTGQNLPPDLAEQASGSRFYLQYAPAKAGFLARPAQLPGSNLERAFESLLAQPEAAPAPGATPRPTRAATPPPGRAPTRTPTPTAKATPGAAR